MKKTMSRAILALVMLFALTSSMYSQLAPSPTLALANVPEASLYGVMYQIDIPVDANYTGTLLPVYTINNSSLTVNYNRVAYFMQIDGNWVWVSMNKFNTTNAQLGIPYNNSGIVFQQTVSAMNVIGSPTSGVTNTTGINGNIEIWPDCYSTGAALGAIGGNGGNYDFNDTQNSSSNCYGSFQVHNYGASQTLFAWNSFMNNNNDDLGIGNSTGSNPDWTFRYNAGSYTTRKLWILVDNGLNISSQPSTLATNACLNGTVSPLTVTTAVLSTTITNYQWYSNTSAANSGGTLVATHTSSLTTDSYTPSTAAAGTLYYYCVVNGTGTTSATSAVSGGVSIENPILTISGTGSICPGSALTLSATSTAAGSTFTWSTGENTSGIVASPGSTTTYTVAGTSSLGCIGVSSPVTLTVNTIPVIAVTNGTICAGDAFVLSPTGAVSYTYSSGSATLMPTATSNYTVSGTSVEGCVGTNSLISVTVNTLPIVSITGTTAICEGSSATLTANGASTYTWSTNANAGSISVNPTITTTYSLTGTSSEGCIGTIAASMDLTVHTLPLVTIAGTNQVCAGNAVSLTASGASTYTWNTTETTAAISVTPSSNTTYSVSGTSVDGCISAASAVTTISVNTLPVLSVSSSTTAICAGASAGFTATGASSYTWSNGSNTASISVSPTSNTTYSVSGTNSLGCVTATQAVASITVNALPTLSISGQSSICTGASASLIASGAATYTFAGLGSTSPLVVSPTLTTSYTLTGTSAAGCAGLPFVKTITVNALPLVTITGTNAICPFITASLVAGGASTYSWTGGLGSSTSIAVSPNANTVYTVTGTDANGCSNTAIHTVSVLPLPTLTVTGPTGICAGESATLTVIGASTYTWSTGSTNTVIVVTPLVATSYSVAGTDANGCINGVFSQAVLVGTSLSVSITGPTLVCLGDPVILGALGGATYTWNTGATSSSITPSPTTTTTYSVIGASGACSNTAVTTISVNPIPTVAINGAVVICTGNAATLTASGADTYTWSNASTSNTVFLNPQVSTTYTVIGTNLNTGCSSAEAVTITVNPIPTVAISGATTVCSGAPLVLSAIGAISYTWSTGAMTNTISVNPSSSINYSAIGEGANGCQSMATIFVSVNPNPALSLVSSAAQVCEGSSVTLTANGAATYTWTNGTNTATLSLTPSVTASYSVTGSNAFGCSSSSAISVSVNPNPTLSINGPTLICTGESADLSVTGAISYSWSTGSNATTIAVTPSVMTSYSVSGTSNLGCPGSSAFVLNVSDCTGLNSIQTTHAANVYPNPSTGIFIIELEEAENTVITIRNVVGQIILTQKAGLFNTISMSEFDNGVYYMSLSKNNVTLSTKALIKN